MNKIMKTAAGTIALVACASVAQAATHAATHHVTSGKIERLNASMHQFVLKHHAYRYNSAIASKPLRTGQKVKLFYRDWKGHRIAYKIVHLAS